MELYHGSNSIIKKPNPRLNTSNGKKDFSWGFYCTELYEQAKEWAQTRAKLTSSPVGVVNVYNYIPKFSLNILQFNTESYEWLNFMLKCREGYSHNYDIVEGPVGDDKFWHYLQALKAGKITKEKVLKLAKFRNKKTHQICFCSEKAVECLKFSRSEEV